MENNSVVKSDNYMLWIFKQHMQFQCPGLEGIVHPCAILDWGWAVGESFNWCRFADFEKFRSLSVWQLVEYL